MAEGLLAVAAGENVVRLVPPLVLTDADIDAGVGDDPPRPSAAASPAASLAAAK